MIDGDDNDEQNAQGRISVHDIVTGKGEDLNPATSVSWTATIRELHKPQIRKTSEVQRYGND